MTDGKLSLRVQHSKRNVHIPWTIVEGISAKDFVTTLFVCITILKCRDDEHAGLVTMHGGN